MTDSSALTSFVSELSLMAEHHPRVQQRGVWAYAVGVLCQYLTPEERDEALNRIEELVCQESQCQPRLFNV